MIGCLKEWQFGEHSGTYTLTDKLLTPFEARAIAKSLSDSRWPYTVIPAYAGIQSFQSRGTRDWTPAFAGVTGRENVIIFGNCYNF